MKAYLMGLAVAGAGLLAATGAQAQSTALPEQGAWSGKLAAGADFALNGDVHGGASAPVADLGALNPTLAGASATLAIESRSFDDIYDAAYYVEGEIAYGVSDSTEVFGALRYVQADDGETVVGNALVDLTDDGSVDATIPVQGQFSGYEAYSLEGGVRQYYRNANWPVTPYAAARVGVTQVDAIQANFIIDTPIANGDIALTGVPFYDDTTTYTVGGDVGFVWPVGERGGIGVEAGLRYTGDLDGDDSAIGGLGLASINEEGSRWSATVGVRGVIRF